ncbi:unnamed protein product [Larinioides sclopetarius]|uniref:Uncharacterized protein n=1 Tax=Larinioides sclopetarius TaxID=280406 RepID=A0AAV2AFL9_9ARAC
MVRITIFLNENNETPVDVAMNSTLNKNIQIVASLKLISCLFSAVKENDISKVEDLLNEGLKFSEFGYANLKIDKNISFLHYVVRKGYDKIMSLLLKYYADPNARTEDVCTPLHYAVRFSHPKIVNSLLQNGAIFDVKCKDKKTPKDYAIDKDVIDLLVFLQALFTKIRNNEKLTLDSLASLRDLDTIKAVMRARNSCGKTLITFAVLKEHPEVELLKSLFQHDVTVQCQRADIPRCVLDIQEVMFKLLLKEEKYDEAEILIEKIYKIRREILGDCNKETLIAMKKLMASVFGLKGRKKEALNMCEEVLNKQRDVFGSDHAETLLTQILIIELMCEEETENGNLTKALKLCQVTLEKLRKVLEITDFILQLKIQVAKQLTNLGKPKEGLDILNEVLEIQKGKFGLYHAKTSDTLFQIAETLFVMGEEEDSLKAFSETHEIRRRVLGPNNAKTLHSYFWVANVLYLQRMFHEAYEIYKNDLESRIAILGENHPDILDTQERMDSIVSHAIFY